MICGTLRSREMILRCGAGIGMRERANDEIRDEMRGCARVFGVVRSKRYEMK